MIRPLSPTARRAPRRLLAAALFAVASTNGASAAWQGINEDGGLFPSFDAANALASDSAGNVVIAGRATALFPGETGPLSPAFVAKYTKNGAPAWRRHMPESGLMTDQFDTATGVSTDAGGNLYVVGHTAGALPGRTNAGGMDITLHKLSPGGRLLWSRQLGTPENDFGWAIAVDADGNATLAGETHGQMPGHPAELGRIVVARYDKAGRRLWLRQWGGGTGFSGEMERGRGVALDAAGNAYVAGCLINPFDGTGNPGFGHDAYVAKFAVDGTRQWFSRIASQAHDEAFAIAASADGRRLYVTGESRGDFSRPGFPGREDGLQSLFVARLDGGAGGALRWAKNLAAQPTPDREWALVIGYGITTDAAGSAAWVTGVVNGTLPGTSSQSEDDIVVARYAADGRRQWLRQFGAAEPSGILRNDRGYATALNPAGKLFVAGEASGAFGLPNPGTDDTDWFVMKLDPADGAVY